MFKAVIFHKMFAKDFEILQKRYVKRKKYIFKYAYIYNWSLNEK